MSITAYDELASRHVLFFEPNDSWVLRSLTRYGLSFPYELTAVSANECVRGGLRDGPIPNYIYRWTGREAVKCVASYQPEREFDVHAHPYWDFYVNEYELLGRKDSKVGRLAQVIGARRFIRLLRIAQWFLNLVPPLRSQGNKFFCAIQKKDLQTWIEKRPDGYFLKK
jgi:hypothetical protein